MSPFIEREGYLKAVWEHLVLGAEESKHKQVICKAGRCFYNFGLLQWQGYPDKQTRLGGWVDHCYGSG